jgi:hypothetical protein
MGTRQVRLTKVTSFRCFYKGLYMHSLAYTSNSLVLRIIADWGCSGKEFHTFRNTSAPVMCAIRE